MSQTAGANKGLRVSDGSCTPTNPTPNPTSTTTPTSNPTPTATSNPTPTPRPLPDTATGIGIGGEPITVPIELLAALFLGSLGAMALANVRARSRRR